MYLKVNKFLLSHEYLNMNKVPGFYQFFYSSDFEVMLLKSSRSLGDARNRLHSHGCHSGILPVRIACCPAGAIAQAVGLQVGRETWRTTQACLEK